MRLSHLTSRSLASSFKGCVVFSCFQPRQGRQMLAQGEALPKASETLGRRPNVFTSPGRGDRNTHSCGCVQDSLAPAGAPCSCRALSQGCASASPWANIGRPCRGGKPPKATPSNYWPGSG